MCRSNFYKTRIYSCQLEVKNTFKSSLAGIFAGSFILERMFAIPGLGFYYVKAVSDNDYTMVIGLTIFFAILFVGSLIVVDILYGIVDPRIRVAKGKK